ncbi:MAG: PQQ-binding-like beta-propeller repeat protein [Vulcanimicrobiaceae bacterium]
MSACGGGGSSGIPAAQPASYDTSPPVSATPGVVADDWTMFAHDALRTGYQPQATGLSSATAGSLSLRWTYHMNGGIKASPLVAGGVVFVAGLNGTVAALDARTGSPLWQTSAGGPVAMTPTLADGLLFVGVHTMPGAFLALDASSGAALWSTSFPGGVRGEALVYGGAVYVGETSGDPPYCTHAGVHAFNETTGAPLWTWYVQTAAGDGGSVWSPISFDGSGLLFGTGNSCSQGVATSNAAVRLTTNGSVVWYQPEANSLSDDDIGGGVAVINGNAIVTSKNGFLYSLEAATGALYWDSQIGPVDGYGGIGTPSSDGQTIVASGGYVNDPTKVTANPGGRLYGFDRRGDMLWSQTTQNPIFGSAAINDGVTVTALDAALTALNLVSGKALWSHTLSSTAYASPVIVPSGVYAADDAGDVYAFALPGSSPAVIRRR